MQPDNQPQPEQAPILEHKQVEQAQLYSPAPNQAPVQPQPVPVGVLGAPQTASDAAAIQHIENVAQYPVDYLNQIATPMPVKTFSPVVIFGLIAAVLIAAGAGLFFAIKSLGPPDVSTQLYSLQARLDTLDKVTKGQGPRLTQNDISGINGTLNATVLTMQANLKAYMESKGLKNTKAVNAQAKQLETAYSDKLIQTLNDAYLTGTLDRSYSNEMTYQVTILKSKLQQLKSSARSKSFDEFYEKNAPTLDTVTERLSEFKSTK